MNRREFLKKSLEGIVVLGSIPLISSCGKNPVSSDNYDLGGIFIDRESIADEFGNHDGITSRTEIDDINKYFKSNTEAWGLGGFPEAYYNKNEIPLSEVINVLKGYGLSGPFKNESELRKFYEGTFPRSPVGIYVFVTENGRTGYRFKHYYKSPSGCISEHKWSPMVVKVIEYEIPQ